MTSEQNSPVIYWSYGGSERTDERLHEPQQYPDEMRFTSDGRYYAGKICFPAMGTAVAEIVSPRPLRLWCHGKLLLDESLYWRMYEREMRVTVIFPCLKGEADLLVEVGERPTWGEFIERDCPSRNRDKVRQALLERHPDQLRMSVNVTEQVTMAGASLRFLPSQYHEDGVTWQLIMVKPLTGYFREAPSLHAWSPADKPEESMLIYSGLQPGFAREATPEAEKLHGYHRYFVPVSNQFDQPAPLRKVGEVDTRVEPSIEIVRFIPLTIENSDGQITCTMPAYESLGRLAPQREFNTLAWLSYEEAKHLLPEPILPDHLAWLRESYDAAWQMLYSLVRHPKRESGLPSAYLGTASKNFLEHQFVWDSSFTAMCTAYGWRALPAYATLNFLYSRQFDGGYLHREHDVRDGVPAAFEPDFSPNPPIMSVAEWAIFAQTGDQLRLAKVYPALNEIHCWLRVNRRLPDGTYWTTGLANGLDNSPSLGEGYPDLTAQMAQDAEMLGNMARVLGLGEDAKHWEEERIAIGEAMNAHLWSEPLQIFSTSLCEGGHNPNKVVTAFWPLWTGLVPEERVQALASHVKDPKSFWRHHPIPSLAADSTYYRPDGDYWRGSSWSPTTFAAIKGFERANRHDVAYEITLRHLECLTDVLRTTGHIWENYCAERSERGNWSGPDYCWSALGPIAALFEIIIGIQPDAMHNTLLWRLPNENGIGIRNLALGPATITVRCAQEADAKRVIFVETDRRFTLVILRDSGECTWSCPPGGTRLELT